MISLKLAEYNKEGKFKRFLNCGIEDRQFLFGDKVIRINGLCEEDYYKDEKDPLNRFNGRFDGRIYGEGRFVLLEGREGYYYDENGKWTNHIYWEDDISGYNGRILSKNMLLEQRSKPVGNLHENPELWEKIR